MAQFTLPKNSTIDKAAGKHHPAPAGATQVRTFKVYRYDPDSGQLLSGSFMDYCMPRADDLPSFRFASQETLNPNNPLGVKGSGESGSIGAPAAVANAVVDALWHLGIGEINMPMTPMKVWRAIRDAQASGRAAAPDREVVS